MFRFDSFKKNNNSTTTLDNNDPLTTDATQSNTSFLQRIASSDTILGVNTKRPILSKSTSINSTNTTTTTSFSIPMPTNSWGMLALSKLQDTEDSEMDDIVDLLLNREKVMSVCVLKGAIHVLISTHSLIVGHIAFTCVYTFSSLSYH